MKRKHNLILISLFTICVVLFARSSYTIISQYYVYQTAENEYKEILELYHTKEKLNPISKSKGKTVNTEKSKQKTEYVSPVDFESLEKINPDTCAWISIAGTVIDYPIVQTSNNETYLFTTFRGKKNSSGAIFIDMQNQSDFSDQNTIIYGHNMKNGSMFATLIKYKEQSFYNLNPNVTVYTSNKKYICKIFSAYVTLADSPAYTVNFSNINEFGHCLKYMENKSMITCNVMVKNSDRIITLSTCDYSYSNARMVVHAVVYAAGT